jgi:hypothetical protein
MMSKRALASVLVFGATLLAAIVLACGPNAANVPLVRQDGDHCPVGGCKEGGIGPEDAGPITIPDEPLENWDTTDAGLLTGIFAVEATVKARAGVEVELKQLYRLRLVQKGTEIHQKTTLCSLKLPDVPGVATLQIPQKLQTLITQKSTEVTGNYLSSDAVFGAAYTPPPFLVLLGAQLANPATDPLPSLEAGAGEIDEDNDGNPGVTILANTVTCTDYQQLYVALRTFGSLSGTVQTQDVITGLAQIHLNQSVLGYSDPCLGVAAQILIQVEPDSPFRAQRVGPDQDVDQNGNVSCPEIVINAPTIFPDWAN